MLCKKESKRKIIIKKCLEKLMKKKTRNQKLEIQQEKRRFQMQTVSDDEYS